MTIAKKKHKTQARCDKQAKAQKQWFAAISLAQMQTKYFTALQAAPINRAVVCPKCKHSAELICLSGDKYFFSCSNIHKIYNSAGVSQFSCSWNSRLMSLMEAEALCVSREAADDQRREAALDNENLQGADLFPE